jgi:hypothetical protein
VVALPLGDVGAKPVDHGAELELPLATKWSFDGSIPDAFA